jgi:isopentenyl diphosphate isomerase/L-lactate dehydrogenase-like FMN-dependent dehydrogenase
VPPAGSRYLAASGVLTTDDAVLSAYLIGWHGIIHSNHKDHRCSLSRTIPCAASHWERQPKDDDEIVEMTCAMR